ncbi:MAG: hypothetical protein V3V99_05480 [candidate division Zixibacteria bacterium]
MYSSGYAALFYGDANCNGGVKVAAAVWLINTVFKGGPGSCECK